MQQSILTHQKRIFQPKLLLNLSNYLHHANNQCERIIQPEFYKSALIITSTLKFLIILVCLPINLTAKTYLANQFMCQTDMSAIVFHLILMIDW